MKKIFILLFATLLLLYNISFAQEGVIIPEDKKNIEDLYDPDFKETPTITELSEDDEQVEALFGTDADIKRRIEQILSQKEISFDNDKEKKRFIQEALKRIKGRKNALNNIPTFNEINKVIENLITEYTEEDIKENEKLKKEKEKNTRTKKYNDKVTLIDRTFGGWIPQIYLGDEWSKGINLKENDIIPVTILIRTHKFDVMGDIEVFAENINTGDKHMIYKENSFSIPRKFVQINFDWNGSIYGTSDKLPDGQYKIFCIVNLYDKEDKKFGEIIRYWGLFLPDYLVYVGEINEDLKLINELQRENADKDLGFTVVEKEDSIVVDLGEIFFDFSSTKLKEGMKDKLDVVSNILKKFSDYEMKIEGHTDNIGTKEINQEYSEERAEVVAQYLIEKGLEEKYISTKGWGYSKPSTTNETAEGRALNRRVEIILIKKNK